MFERAGWIEAEPLRVGLRSAPLRYAGQRFGLARGVVSGSLLGHEHGQRIAETLRHAVGHR